MYGKSLADPGTHTDAICPTGHIPHCMHVSCHKHIIVCKCCNLPYLTCYVVTTYRRNPSCQAAACGCADKDPTGRQARQVGGVLWSVWRHGGVGHVLCCGHLPCSGSLLSTFAAHCPAGFVANCPVPLSAHRLQQATRHLSEHHSCTRCNAILYLCVQSIHL